MRIVFLDTVGLLALWDKRDQWHQAAEKAYALLLADNAVMLTTEAVLLECGNAASRLKYRPIVFHLRKLLIKKGRLLVPSFQEIQSAWSNYSTGAIGSAGIVDHISFQVMKRLDISDAFTNDRHFRTQGFMTLF